MSGMRFSILKKALGVFLCICMILPIVPAISFASDVSEWDGTSKNTSWYVSGTTFYLQSAADLAGLSYLVNNGLEFNSCKIYLTCDIDLNDYSWKAIGNQYEDANNVSQVHYFRGDFYGQNHSIVGLNSVATAKTEDSGLFGSIRDSQIYDLSVEGHSEAYVAGGIVGNALDSKIVNCSFSGTVHTSYPEYGCAGGIAGIVGGSTITFCSTYGTISGDDTLNIGKTAGRDMGDSRFLNNYNFYLGAYSATYPPKGYHNVSAYEVSQGLISYPESAWRMSQPASSNYAFLDYYWRHDDNGVYVTKDPLAATRQKFILNPNYTGGTIQTVYGTSTLALPTPIAREGYNFYLWQKGVSFYEVGDVMPTTGEHTFIASWYSSVTNDITVGSPVGGEITVYFADDPTTVYSEGDTIPSVNVGKILVVSYVADPNNTLRSITVDGADISGLIYTVTGANTISADFITSVQTESTVASVTITASGATTYYDTFAEAASFVNNHAALTNTGADSQAVIRLYSDVTIDGGYDETKPCSLPSKPCIIDGENGSSDYLLSVAAVNTYNYFLIPTTGCTFRNIRIRGNISTYLNKTFTFENCVSITYTYQNGYLENYIFDGRGQANFILKGYVSGCSNISGKKITFDNVNIACRNYITANFYEFIGSSSITFTSAISDPTYPENSRFRVSLSGYSSSSGFSGDGTITIKNSGWTPEAGNCIINYTHNTYLPTGMDLSPIILDMGDGIPWRLRKNWISKTVYYTLYNPTISLAADKNYPLALNTDVTLTATPSTLKNELATGATYTWYSCDSEGNNPKLLIADSTTTYTPSTARGGTKYYYCTANDTNGELVKSNIISVTVTGPTYFKASNTLGAQARIVTWDAIRFGASFSLDDIKSEAEAGDIITYGFNVVLKENMTDGQLLGNDLDGIRFFGSADGTELSFTWLEEYEAYTTVQLVRVLRQAGFKVFDYDEQTITFALIIDNMGGDRIYSDVVFRSFFRINGIYCFGTQKYNSIDNIKTAYSSGEGGDSTLYPAEQ